MPRSSLNSEQGDACGQSIEAAEPRRARAARERGVGAWVGGGDQGRRSTRGKMWEVRRAEPRQDPGGSDTGDLHVQGMRAGAEDDVTSPARRAVALSHGRSVTAP